MHLKAYLEARNNHGSETPPNLQTYKTFDERMTTESASKFSDIHKRREMTRKVKRYCI